MKIVQRILSKVVGQEISVEEMELVSGGQQDYCELVGGYGTYEAGSTVIGKCDFQ
jgi:hypothetical protein